MLSCCGVSALARRPRPRSEALNVVGFVVGFQSLGYVLLGQLCKPHPPWVAAASCFGAETYAGFL